MNREIRFRAWDKGHQRMIHLKPHTMLAYDAEDAKLVFGENFHDDFTSSGTDNFDLMQFTGLLDVSGKEIYEGDIVRYGHLALNDIAKFGNEPWLHLPAGVNEGNITTVLETWAVETDVFDWYKLAQAVRSNPDVLNVEVVGNIHENPDLVKKST